MTEQALRESVSDRPLTSLERDKLFVEFAKYGFYGTLTFSIIGAALIFGLACLSAWTAFKIDATSLVLMTLIIAVGAVIFGYLSLFVAPRLAIEARGTKIDVDPAKNR